MVLFQNGSAVNRIEDLLEVGLDEFDNQEYLLESTQINMLVVIELVLNDLVN